MNGSNNKRSLLRRTTEALLAAALLLAGVLGLGGCGAAAPSLEPGADPAASGSLDQAGSRHTSSTSLTIDNYMSTGAYSSLKLVDGRPAIAYMSLTGSSGLTYVRASDALGSAWGNLSSVDSSPGVGYQASMQIVDGFPAIAYAAADPSRIKYVRAQDADGVQWSAPLFLDTHSYPLVKMGSLKMAVVDGRPAIAYQAYNPRSGDSMLAFMRANDADGLSWGAPVFIDTAAGCGSYCDLAVVGGHPAVAYWTKGSKYLYYCNASDADGKFWNQPVQLLHNQTQYLYSNPSLREVGGRPAVALGTDKLRFYRAANAAGTLWQPALILDNTSVGNTSVSMEVIGGLPMVAYSGGGLYLGLVKATSPAGTSWGAPSQVDPGTQSAQWISLGAVMKNGSASPVMSYAAVSVDYSLKYAYDL